MSRAGTCALAVLLVVYAAAPRAGAAATFPYQSCFEIAAQLHDVPLEVLLAVATTESAMNPDARSNANAHGIMQIQWPGTARHLGVQRVSELYNPCLNIDLGARYLRELLDANGGDLERALAAYNYGPSRIRAAAALPAGAQRYVRTVSAHRERIDGAARATTRALEQAALDQDMRFDHGLRARRYAAMLNREISGARFAVEPQNDGSYRVAMLPPADGLGLGDARKLRALGWAGAVPGRER
ncbi:MAG: lytic transglycosylase domain-containing protein [Pseudomonadales bacterium]